MTIASQMSRSISTTSSSSRIDELSRPRGLHPDYKKDRISVYWLDRMPRMPKDGKTKSVLTPRQEELVGPKRKCDSTSCFGDPMWPVSESAKNYTPTPRITSLAHSKSAHPAYLPLRGPATVIPDSALRSRASPRIHELSKAKHHQSLPCIQPQKWDWSDWENRVPRAALTANASARVEMLATPKTSPPSFRSEKSVMWPVSDRAKNGTATQRVLQLSMPRARTMICDDYDPYVIPKGALRAQATPRMEELAVPLPRKSTLKIKS